MLQTIFAVPAWIVFFSPIFLMLWAIGDRMWYGPDERYSDLKFVPMGLIAFEIQV